MVTDLREAHVIASQRWPGVVVDLERFTTFVTARWQEVSPDVRTELLYLTCACATGDAAALAAFERTYGSVIDAALARMQTAVDIDEVKQRVREKLFVGDADTPPRIGEYTGRGELAGWLRAVAVRTALNLRREGLREAPGYQADEAEGLAALLPAAGSDPELATLLERYRADVGAALAEAIAALPDKHRVILRYHYAERLSIDQIGVIFGVHKTTAFRRLEQAREELVESARAALKTRLRLDDAGLQSLVRVVNSQLEITLSGLFRTGA